MNIIEKNKLQDVYIAAKGLLGSYLVRKIGNKELIGKIVEVEIYHEKDPASHSCHGQTKRCEVMFGPAGFSYIYLVYGMYYCLNIVCGKVGEGSAILIRAVEPIDGINFMQEKRKTNDLKNLTNGPGKLCQALNITKKENNINLLNKKSPIHLEIGDQVASSQIISTTRIGIAKAKDKLLRFYIKDSVFVSFK